MVVVQVRKNHHLLEHVEGQGAAGQAAVIRAAPEERHVVLEGERAQRHLQEANDLHEDRDVHRVVDKGVLELLEVALLEAHPK
eukprot:CAMPEP_0171161896 /NCGR_PEP_ID=MMETSP0790-20130122/4310_1 /TAXON_ID=2925 /ORGANISM="Alexandrium catenella, Strain OF101" /LENGTH=82 /DNA_ID=CAMNT_0011626477 /DNA_START=303 /DNA_END=551 /DNA_ORIENTATION=+